MSGNVEAFATSPNPISARITTFERHLFGCSWRHAHRLLPGIALALSVMLAADRLGKQLVQFVMGAGNKSSGVSGITCAIVMGLLLANVLQVRAMLRPGLEFAVRKMLRLGIILVGIKLSFLDVLHMGFWGIP